MVHEIRTNYGNGIRWNDQWTLRRDNRSERWGWNRSRGGRRYCRRGSIHLSCWIPTAWVWRNTCQLTLFPCLFLHLSPLTYQLVQKGPGVSIRVTFQENGHLSHFAFVFDLIKMSEMDLSIVLLTLLEVFTRDCYLCVTQMPPVGETFTVIQARKGIAPIPSTTLQFPHAIYRL